MRYGYNDANVPVCAPNSFDGPHVNPERAPDGGSWEFDPVMLCAGYIEHAEDGDFVEAGTLVRVVFADEQRDRLLDNIVGHVLGGVREPVLSRVFDYGKERGHRTRQACRGGCPRRTRRPTARIRKQLRP